MAKASSCPPANKVQALALGNLPVEEMESLVSHLESCPDCLERVRTISPADTLIDALAKARNMTPGQEGATVERLIEKLTALNQPRAISFSCPGCGKGLKTKPELAGKKVKCPKCGIAVPVPETRKEEQGAEMRTLPPRDAAPPELAAEGRTLPPKDVQEPPSIAATASAQQTGSGTQRPADDSDEEQPWDFLAPPEQPDELGRLGPYRVLKVLGAGGMGVVFRAEDPQLKRLVALKAMLPAIAGSGSAKKRFLREAQAAAAIKHNHIVTIFQVGEDRGAPYLAMEFLQGEPLDERLKREMTMPIADVLRIGREVAEGLAAAHDHGLIHRDIKPANVWLESVVRRPSSVAKKKESSATDHGQRTTASCAKILDFGLARAAADQTQLTQSGAIVGTPAFMAPEQAVGEKVDHRCDLFSLGCMLYRMCTGELPFKGKDTIAILSSLALDTPKEPRLVNPQVPGGLNDLIMHLLAKEPDKRPPSAHEVAEALAALEAGEKPAVPRYRGKSSRRPLVLAGAALFAAAAIAAIIVIIRDRQGNEVARIKVPDGGSAEIKNGGKEEEPAKAESPKFALRFEKGGMALPLSYGGQHPITLEAWVRQDRKLATDGAVFAVHDTMYVVVGGQHMYVQWWPKSGGVINITYPAPLPPDRENHIAVVYDGESLALFLNGESLVRKAVAPNVRRDNPQRLVLAEAAGGNFFSGALSEIRFSKVPRYQKNFTPKRRFEPDKDTVGLYHCDEGEGVLLKDASGNAHHASIGGGKWVKADGSPLSTSPGPAPAAIPLTLDPAKISAAERYDWQPKELVAVLGEHRLRLWGLQDIGVTCVAFNPDGKALAIGGHDSFVRIWDLATMRQQAMLPRSMPGENVTRALAFAQGGKMLVRANGMVSVWDLAVLKPRRSDSLGGGSIIGLTPDGKTLAAGHGGQITVWSRSGEAAKERAKFSDPKNGINCVALSADGTMLAWGEDKTVRLYDLSGAKAKVRAILTEHKATVMSVAISPDGKILVSADRGDKAAIRLWDLTAEKPKEMTAFDGYGVFCLAFSADGKTLAAGSSVDGSVRLIDVRGPGSKVRTVFGAEVGEVNGLAFSPNGSTLACGGTVHSSNAPVLWDLTGKHPAKKIQVQGNALPVHSISFAADGKTLVCGSHDRVQIWDMRGNAANMLAEHRAPAVAYFRMALAANGRIMTSIQTGTQTPDLQLWDLSEPAQARPVLFKGHKSVWCTAFSPDGKTLATGGGASNGEVHLWDLSGEDILLLDQNEAKRRGVIKLPKGQGAVDMAFSPDGKTLAVSYGPNAVGQIPTEAARIWDLTGAAPREGAEIKGDCIRLAFAPDGKSLVTRTAGGDIRVWDVTQAKPKLRGLLEGYATGWNLAVAPDSKTIAVVGLEGEVRLWDGMSRRWDGKSAKKELPGWNLPGAVHSVAFHPGGRHLVTGNGNGTVYVLRLPETAKVATK